MSFIDSKGRLFGKINIIDLGIIVLVVIIIPAFFYVYKIMGTTPRRVKSQWLRVEAVTFAIPQITSLLKPGDVAYDKYGDIDGRLVRIINKNDEKLKKYMHEGKMGGELLPYMYSEPVVIELELLCTKSSKGERWYYHRRPVIVGVAYQFRVQFDSGKYVVDCFVLKIKE